MKKYLFLLVLFVVYVIIRINVTQNTIPVFSYDNDNRSVKTITLRFKNGINSTELLNRFKKYQDEYLINNIKLDNKEFSLECNSMDKCIKDIFYLEDEEFSQKYLINGFKINEINFISYDDDGNNEYGLELFY